VPSAVISADIAITDQNAAVHPADIGSSQTLVDAAVMGVRCRRKRSCQQRASWHVVLHALQNWRKQMR
jgi:hypothetical protein